MKLKNIFECLPDSIDEETIDLLVESGKLKIERIVSRGQSSAEKKWYDQEHNEWVMVVAGEAILAIKGEEDIHLTAGSHINLPAHTLHRVSWTHPDTDTIWLAVHYP